MPGDTFISGASSASFQRPCSPQQRTAEQTNSAINGATYRKKKRPWAIVRFTNETSLSFISRTFLKRGQPKVDSVDIWRDQKSFRFVGYIFCKFSIFITRGWNLLYQEQKNGTNNSEFQSSLEFDWHLNSSDRLFNLQVLFYAGMDWYLIFEEQTNHFSFVTGRNGTLVVLNFNPV